MGTEEEMWLLAEVLADPDIMEVVQCALLEAGALGLEIVQQQRANAATFSVEVDAKAPAAVIGYFPIHADQDLICQMLQAFVRNAGFFNEVYCSFRTLRAADYQKAFKDSFSTIQIGARLFIVPSWESDSFAALDPQALIIHLDPEMAFGTGQHETTQLCAEHLIQLLEGQKTPRFQAGLDLGTGTGILAILMKKLGLTRVVGLDTDPDAILAARENAKKNAVDLELTCIAEQSDYGLNEFDIVVANIFAHTLIEKSREIIFSVRPKGRILLSGIIDSQVKEVIRAFLQLPVVHLSTHMLGEWALLEFERLS